VGLTIDLKIITAAAEETAAVVMITPIILPEHLQNQIHQRAISVPVTK